MQTWVPTFLYSRNLRQFSGVDEIHCCILWTVKKLTALLALHNEYSPCKNDCAEN